MTGEKGKRMSRRGYIGITTGGILFGFAPAVEVAAATQPLPGFQDVLESLHRDMLPLYDPLIFYARLLAGFAALWFIGFRVWASIARAQPVDLLALARPFVLGFCILIFPQVLDFMNGILKPLTHITGELAWEAQEAAEQAQRQLDHVKRIRWETVPQEEAHSGFGPGAPGLDELEPKNSGGWWAGIQAQVQMQMERASWNLRLAFRAAMGEVLEWIFLAASLCLDLLRNFYLLILSLFGPLVFAFSCFDGMGHSVVAWITKYVHVTLWLPVSHILGAMLSRIQEQMILRDIAALNAGDPAMFSSSDLGYMIFMIMGIVSYGFVPTASGYLLTWGSGGWIHRPATQWAAQTLAGWNRKGN